MLLIKIVIMKFEGNVKNMRARFKKILSKKVLTEGKCYKTLFSSHFSQLTFLNQGTLELSNVRVLHSGRLQASPSNI
jgi:hypothetical protein